MVQTPSAELATACCRATDSTLHQRRAQPWAADARKDTETEELLALVAPAAPDFCSEDYESLRPSTGQLRVARDFPLARHDKRDSRPRVGTGDGAPARVRGETRVASQHVAAQDRLASNLNPRPFNDETTPGQQARAWAGEVVVPVCIDLNPTAVSAFRATVQGREGQGQPKAAPHGDVHQVGCKGGMGSVKECIAWTKRAAASGARARMVGKQSAQDAPAGAASTAERTWRPSNEVAGAVVVVITVVTIVDDTEATPHFSTREPTPQYAIAPGLGFRG